MMFDICHQTGALLAYFCLVKSIFSQLRVQLACRQSFYQSVISVVQQTTREICTLKFKSKKFCYVWDPVKSVFIAHVCIVVAPVLFVFRFGIFSLGTI